LRLYGDPSEQPLSTNFYVLSTRTDSLDEKKSTWYITPEARYADLTGLERLPEVSLQVHSTHQEKKDTTFVSVTLKNPTDHLAFMVYLDLKKGATSLSVTPVFWQENFFSLLPGEERTVSGYCHTRNLRGQIPHLTVGGWNIEASGRTLP
jgi:exo-1,4-beta-D-glucosaminidase